MPAALAVPAGLEPFYEQELDWGRCEGRSVTLECASLTVPVDYDEPDGATLDVALMRTESTRPDPVGAPRGGRRGAGLRDPRRALVPPGQRGAPDDVRRRRVRPAGDRAQRRAELPRPRPRRTLRRLDRTPDTPDEVGRSRRRPGTRQACEEAADGLLPFLGTEQVVQDLDVLRAALGEAGCTSGRSYGTLLGGEYAARFPDRVGRMALLSPVPAGRLDPLEWLHDGRRQGRPTSTGPWTVRRHRAGVPAGDDREGARDRLEAYLAGLDERPVEVDGVLLTRERALDGVEGGLGNGPEGWGDLRRALEAAYRGMPVLLSDMAEPAGHRWPDT